MISGGSAILLTARIIALAVVCDAPPSVGRGRGGGGGRIMCRMEMSNRVWSSCVNSGVCSALAGVGKEGLAFCCLLHGLKFGPILCQRVVELLVWDTGADKWGPSTKKNFFFAWDRAWAGSYWPTAG